MTPHRRWRIAVLLGAGVLVNYFDRVNVSVAHDALHAEFGLTNIAFGYVLSAYSWTYAALQLPMGVLLDRFGVRAIGRLSALLWSVASFAAAAASGIASFIGARLLLGVGEAPTFPANAKAIGMWFPRDERSFATALFDAAAKFASGIGVPLIGAVLIRFGWRLSFAATGIISFLYFAAFYFVYRDPKDDAGLTRRELEFIERGGANPGKQKDQPGASAPLWYLLTQRKVIGLTLGFAAYNYCFYLFLTWLPSYFSALHMNLEHSILFTSVPWLFGTATDLLVGGWLVDALVRRGYPETIVRQSILVGGTVLGLAIAGAMFTANPFVAAFWISISLGGLSAAAPVGWSIPSLIAPRNSVGKVGGIVNFGNQISAIVAPIATGYFAGAANSFSRAFAAAAVILLIGIAGYLLLLGKIEPVPEPFGT
ncbi:MAG: MFS transporter [Acidobacteriaceae bacterium]|nr:MFS transporter [Acidobacteriaceae bacterium]MBV8569505.1 MFS transporter [Acidobacteriaceae bacterium]